MPEVTGSGPVSSTIEKRGVATRPAFRVSTGREGTRVRVSLTSSGVAAHTPASMRSPALTLSLAFAAGFALAPAVSVAGDSHGKVPGGVVAPGRPSRVQHGGVNPGGVHRSVGGIGAVAPQPQPAAPQGVGPRPFVQQTITLGVAAPIIYTLPAYSYAVVVTHAPPVSYEPPVSAAPPPAIYNPNVGDAISMAPSPPRPTPGVVEFPTGRYELYGDGMATPYTWVWIPNPPTAPPAPPTAPPSQAPDPGDPLVPSRRELFRWTDEAGVAYWTDRLDAVPQQYRAEAEEPRLR